MADKPEQQKLDELEARIQKAQGEPSDNPVEAAKGSNAGYELAGTILGCLLVGWLIDRYFQTSPWGILGMLLVGILAGFANVWRALNGYDHPLDPQNKDKEKTDGR